MIPNSSLKNLGISVYALSSYFVFIKLRSTRSERFTSHHIKMGACATMSSGESPENHRTHKAIEKKMQGDYVSEKTINKLLLLGSGASGKSTLFRHWSMVLENNHFKNRYTNDDMVASIRRNCLHAMHRLLQKTTQIHELKKRDYEPDQYGFDPNFGNKPFYIKRVCFKAKLWTWVQIPPAPKL